MAARQIDGKAVQIAVPRRESRYLETVGRGIQRPPVGCHGRMEARLPLTRKQHWQHLGSVKADYLRYPKKG